MNANIKKTQNLYKIKYDLKGHGNLFLNLDLRSYGQLCPCFFYECKVQA